jgi:hypothetical protein
MQRMIMCVGLVVIIAASFLTYGCGGADDPLLDEVGQRYTGNISFSDADEDGVLAIDTVQDACAVDEDTGEVTEYETFTDVYIGQVTVSVAEDAPGISLKSYSINYTALGSATGSSTLEVPPDLIDPPDGYYTIDISSGGTATFALTYLTMDTKDEFNIEMGWLYYDGSNWVYDLPEPGELQVARYRMTLILHFEDEYGVDRDITFERTLYLSEYDNC